jgi:hypothetical protein
MSVFYNRLPVIGPMTNLWLGLTEFLKGLSSNLLVEIGFLMTAVAVFGGLFTQGYKFRSKASTLKRY